LEIEIEDNSFVGMPFVLLSGGKWLKKNGSDFYVDFGIEPQQAPKVTVFDSLRKDCLLCLI